MSINSYTIRQKTQAIQFVKEGNEISEASKELDIPAATIRYWLKDKPLPSPKGKEIQEKKALKVYISRKTEALEIIKAIGEEEDFSIAVKQAEQSINGKALVHELIQDITDHFREAGFGTSTFNEELFIKKAYEWKHGIDQELGLPVPDKDSFRL